jgi:hypothetical protein
VHLDVLVMTTMAVTSMTTTVVVEAVEAVAVRGLVVIAFWSEHKSLESPQHYSLDMP